MRAFYFFIFIGIAGYFLDSIKKLRQESTTKNKVTFAVSVILLFFGIYLLAEALRFSF